MSRNRNRPAMLVGIVLVTLILTNQWLSSELFNKASSSNGNQDTLYHGAISNSAANEIVQLTGTDQVVRYIAQNGTAVNVGNTPAANNLTLPATTAPATVLDATNTSLRFDMNPFTSNHTIEKDAGYAYPWKSSGTTWLNTSASRMPYALQKGTDAPGTYIYLNREPLNTAWVINSSANNVTVNLEYPNIGTTISGNDSIRIDMLLKMAFNTSVEMNVWVYDNRYGQGWVQANTAPFIFKGDVSVTPFTQTIDIPDYRAQAIRILNPCINVSLRFSASTPFKALLYQAKTKLYQTYQIPIHADNWVALSFDLRGNAWVSGFLMHVRSFKPTAAENLQMSVFRTNNSAITLNQITATTTAPLYHKPNLGQLVAGTSRTFTNYAQDKIAWFNFTAPVYMTTGNYFVVLNSTVPAGQRYSIVVLPWEDPAGAIPRQPEANGHTVITSTNDGTSWSLYTVQVSSSPHVVDGAPFKVGVRRQLIPSDVNLKINATTVRDWQMLTNVPFSSTNYEWGRGNWSVTNLNARTTTSTLTMPITWNQTVRASFTYNASSSMRIYAEDPAASLLKLSREAPLWKVSYQFNRTKYTGWNGQFFNFTFPSDWSVLNVTYPDGANYFRSEYLSSIPGSRKMYPVNRTSINGLAPSLQQLTYVSWFNSPNYTKSVDTYLRYNAATFHKTAHFVNGDSMSARVSVQTGSGKAVLNGQVNLTLFYPSGNPVTSMTSSVINSTAGFVTRYNFNDASLHTFAGTAVGRHLARVFWFNGSEAGIYYHDVFKVNYTVIGHQVDELLDEGLNQVSGSFISGANESIPTNIVHVSIDKDDVVPVGLVVNKSIDDITFKEFNQTQTVFNPNENISFTVKLKSTSLGLSHEVWTNVQIVQAFQPDRVMMNLSTSPVVLNPAGYPNSERTLALSGTFPALFGSGINAPLRNSLFMTRVRIYVDGYLATTWTSDESNIYAVKMDNATDGTVLATKIVRNYTGTSFSQLFTRANETVYNQPTMFMMLLESSGGVTLLNILARDFTNSMTSVIKDMAAVPVTGDVLTINNSVILSGRLFLEDGKVVNGTTVQVTRWTGSSWAPYYVVGSTTNNSLPTSNGTFSGTFRLPLTYNRTMTVQFTWAGNSTVESTTAFLVVNITEYTPSFTITSRASKIVVVGGSYRNFYTFIVRNTGNTTLMFRDPASVGSDKITGEIATWINAGLLEISPNEEFTFSLVLTAENPGIARSFSTSFTIELHAFSIETKASLNVTQQFTATVQPPDLGSQLASIWYLGYFAAIALLVIIAFLLIKRVSIQAKRPAGAGTLSRGKTPAKGVELPYAIKKGADIATPEGEKKYKSIEEAMAEVKGQSDKETATEAEDSGEGDAEETNKEDAGQDKDSK
ncbi:MAG: hypothetical protein Q6373_009955 [Candidatus Sigynarchaeota archaeon]